MTFKKGQSGNPKGGKKGVGHKHDKTLIVEALRASFAKLGGVKYLVAAAKSNPKAYLSLLARDVVTRIDEKSEQTIVAGEMKELRAMSDGELKRLAHAVDAVITRPEDTA